MTGEDVTGRVIGTRRALGIGAAVLLIAGLVTLASVGAPKPGSSSAVPTRSSAGSSPDGGAVSASASTSVSGSTTAADRSGVARQAGGGSPSAPGGSSAGRSVSGTAVSVPLGPLLPVGQGVHGVTDKVIQVGIPTMDYAALAHAGFAPSGGSTSNIDDSFAVKAATDWVNSHGGIAGRRVEVTEYRVDVNSEATASGRQQEDAAACSSFTQDHHVFAMSGDNMTEDSYLECAKQNKTPAIFSSIGNVAPSYSRLASMTDYWYAPTGFVADRRERAMAKFVVQRKFLKPGDAFALITQDLPSITEAVDTQLKPVLKAEGFTPAAEVRYTEGLSNDWSAAILQFQQHVPPVNKIVFSATTQDMFAPFSFMRAAESQNYRPDYALGTDEHPNQLTLGTSANQLNHVFGMGWMPWSDIGDGTDLTSSTHQCGVAMMAEGISGSPPNYASCEFLFFLQDAFRHATEVSPAGLAAGAAKMAGSYPAVFARQTLYGPDKHDGAVEVRELRYGVDPQACGGSSACLHYTTGALAVPS